MSTTLLLVIVAIVVIAVIIIYRMLSKGRPATPQQLRPGSELPQFTAVDEKGATVSSADLKGSPTIILFVRGNWCPFCTKQVKNLADYYKQLNELGAKLIFITPKPLETTRRVAEFFEIDFAFWLDEGLQITKQLGLFLPSGVPSEHRAEYGENTVWPTALVIDASNTIRYTSLSRLVIDRPKPDRLVKELQKIVGA